MCKNESAIVQIGMNRVKFIPMAELLRRAAAEGYAVPSFCVWNAESMEVVLRTAAKLRAPVILMGGPAEFGLFLRAIEAP